MNILGNWSIVIYHLKCIYHSEMMVSISHTKPACYYQNSYHNRSWQIPYDIDYTHTGWTLNTDLDWTKVTNRRAWRLVKNLGYIEGVCNMQNSAMWKVLCGMDAAEGLALGLGFRVNTIILAEPANPNANPNFHSVHFTYYFPYTAFRILQTPIFRLWNLANLAWPQCRVSTYVLPCIRGVTISIQYNTIQ